MNLEDKTKEELVDLICHKHDLHSQARETYQPTHNINGTNYLDSHIDDHLKQILSDISEINDELDKRLE